MSEPPPKVSVWIYVRLTINTGGFARGDEVWIDAALPQFGPLLEARYLKPVDPPPWEFAPDDPPEQGPADA